MQDLTVIRKYISNTELEYSKFATMALEGFNYYNNFDKIKTTGAAAVDEVNGYLEKIGANPLHCADNRISLNRHRLVVDQKIGYLFSEPPQIDVPSDDTGTGNNATLKQVQDTMGTQWPKVIRQLGLDASNTGKGWLEYWSGKDDTGKNIFDYWYINPLTIRPIYDRSTAKKKLQYLIRAYAFLDDGGNPVTRYEFWDEKEVAYLLKPEATAECRNPVIYFELLPNGTYNIQPHTYGRIPFIEFQNNAHADNDLIMYKDIIDALDKLVSGFANDIDDIQEIVWVLKNYDGEREVFAYNADGTFKTDSNGDPIKRPVDPVQMMKLKKFIYASGDGGIDALRNEIPYEARKAFRDILNEEFWIASQAVNPNPPTAGNQSGVYISFLYGLLEHKSGLMETEFRPSIDEFLKAILHYLGADETTQFNQTWKRTRPQNDTEISTIIAQTPDTVMSDETKTKVHPLVDDWQAERKQIENEQQERQQNYLDSVTPRAPDGSMQNEPPANGQHPNSNDGGGA